MDNTISASEYTLYIRWLIFLISYILSNFMNIIVIPLTYIFLFYFIFNVKFIYSGNNLYITFLNLIKYLKRSK